MTLGKLVVDLSTLDAPVLAKVVVKDGPKEYPISNIGCNGKGQVVISV